MASLRLLIGITCGPFDAPNKGISLELVGGLY